MPLLVALLGLESLCSYRFFARHFFICATKRERQKALKIRFSVFRRPALTPASSKPSPPSRPISTMPKSPVEPTSTAAAAPPRPPLLLHASVVDETALGHLLAGLAVQVDGVRPEPLHEPRVLGGVRSADEAVAQHRVGGVVGDVLRGGGRIGDRRSNEASGGASVRASQSAPQPPIMAKT